MGLGQAIKLTLEVFGAHILYPFCSAFRKRNVFLPAGRPLHSYKKRPMIASPWAFPFPSCAEETLDYLVSIIFLDAVKPPAWIL
jgi:hypothetical protein